MTAAILDGKRLAQAMQEELASQVADFVRQTGIKPGLATVLVGENPSSQIYVRNKRAACARAGMESFARELPSATQAEVLALVERLNADPAVHGILVQLPLPKHIDESAIVDAVHPTKDVDGFGPMNLGLLLAGRPRFLACTPNGIMQILARHGIDPAGKHAVVVGRSNIVGKPMALMLLQKHATVTVCHSRTPDLGSITRQADILVVAVGKRNTVTAEMVRPGAVVIDVGTNPRPDDPKKITGDVDIPGVSQVASAITPVPGGVGPMTITMLLYNTLLAARLQNGDAK